MIAAVRCPTVLAYDAAVAAAVATRQTILLGRPGDPAGLGGHRQARWVAIVAGVLLGTYERLATARRSIAVTQARRTRGRPLALGACADCARPVLAERCRRGRCSGCYARWRAQERAS